MAHGTKPLNLWVEGQQEKGGGYVCEWYCPALPHHPLPVDRDHLPLEGLQEHMELPLQRRHGGDQNATTHGAGTLRVHRPALIRTKVLFRSLALGFAAARFAAKPSALWLAADKVKGQSR